MSIKNLINKKFLLYIFYTLFTVLFFVWYLFPSDYFADYIEKNLKVYGEGVVADIDSVKPVLPVGLKLTGIAVSIPLTSPVEIEYIKIKLNFFSLVKLKPEIDFSAGLFGGIIKGKLKIKDRDINKLSIDDISVSGINIGLLSVLVKRYIPGHTISGELDARGSYTAEGRGYGKVKLFIRQLKLKPDQAYLTLESLSFSEIAAEFEVKNKRIEIEKCDIEGLEFDGSVKGSVIVKNPVNRSVLRLSGKFKPEKDFIEKMPLDLLFKKKVKFGNELPFKISGTINKPRFR